MEIQRLFNKVIMVLRSAQGRNILTFFVFFAISAIFWLLLALNDDVQDNYDIPVTIEDFPENATMLSGCEPILNVTVKDKSSSLMKFIWGNKPVMKIRSEDFTKPNDTTFLYTNAQLNSAIRDIFGTNATLVSMRPDSLKFIYTTNPGIKVAVNVISDIHTLPQYAYAGHPILSTDSVTIFTNSHKRFKINSLSTKQITLANLTDTTTVNVKFDVPAGMRVVPSDIDVVFPVEPLVSKQKSVPIEVQNAPEGVKVITFPAMAEVSYLIPKSMYATENAEIKVIVDYNEINPASKSIPVELMRLPYFYKSVTTNPSKVDYVIEHIN